MPALTQTTPSGPAQPSVMPTVPQPINGNSPPAAVMSHVSLALVSPMPVPQTVPRPVFRLSRSVKTFIGPVILCHPSVAKTGLVSKPSHSRTPRRPQRPLKSRHSSVPPVSQCSLYERAVELVRNVRVGYKRENGKVCTLPLQYKGGFWLQESDAVRGIVLAGYLAIAPGESNVRMFYRIRDGLDWIPKSCLVPFQE